MKEEFLFFPRVHLVFTVVVLVITGLPVGYFLIEAKASGGAVAVGWFCGFSVLMGVAYYFTRYEMRSIVVQHDVIKFESASSSLGKFRAFKISDLNVVEVGPDALLVESKGKKIAFLRRSTMNDYLWKKLRERLGLEGALAASQSTPLLWIVHVFHPRQISYVISTGMIYVSVSSAMLALIFHADFEKAIHLVVSAFLPVVAVALFVTRKDLLKLTLSETEVEVSPSGSTPLLPGRRRRIPRQNVVFEILPDRILIKDQGDVVGIIRRNSSKKEDWKKLLVDIAEYEAVGCRAVPTE